MPEIQIKNSNKRTFSIRNYYGELLHIANSNQYHIIFFNKDCECEVNFNSCKVKRTQALFLNASDVFRCKTRGNTLSQFSFDYAIFDKEHCETERFINGFLFNNLLDFNFLTFDSKGFSKFKSQFDIIMSFQNKDDFQNSNLVFKEAIVQAIAKKHKQSFYEEEVSERHQTVYNYLSLVNEHFKMEHNVSVYAQILRVQPKILTKVFFDLKIKNPKSYLNKRIILSVKKVLAYSRTKSTDIAYETGFADPAYFARFFKKNTGLSPKQFRAQQNHRESTI